jgi:hypothetical protein
VKCEDGIHFIELSPDAGSITSGVFRRVPLHGHIIEQGFLDFVETRRGLRLFHMPDDKAKRTIRQTRVGRSPSRRANILPIGFASLE